MRRKRSLHKMLITRLVLVTMAVSVIMVVLAVITEDRRINEVANDRMLIRMGTLKALILDQLEHPKKMDQATIQHMLHVVAYKGTDISVGHYVLIRILDPALTEVARFEDPDHDNMSALVRSVRESASRPFSANPVPEIESTRIAGMTYIHTRMSLHNRLGAVAAYADCYFATSPEEERKLFANILRSIGVSLSMVFVTSLVLYPVILGLLRRLERLSESLLESNLEALGMLGSAIAKRDSDTDIHNYRVTIYSVRIAEALGLDDDTIRILIRGAFLHDIGKIGIRDAVLLKPGKLTEEEFAEMKKHVDYGVDIVVRSAWFKSALPVVDGHHEKFDGKGYPHGLEGTGIHLLARIFAIADVFDALTSQRPYKKPLSFDESICILLQGRGTHFDSEILDVFISIARPLFDLYGNKENNERPRKDLAEIQNRYYKVNIAAFLK